MAKAKKVAKAKAISKVRNLKGGYTVVYSDKSKKDVNFEVGSKLDVKEIGVPDEKDE